MPAEVIIETRDSMRAKHELYVVWQDGKVLAFTEFASWMLEADQVVAASLSGALHLVREPRPKPRRCPCTGCKSFCKPYTAFCQHHHPTAISARERRDAERAAHVTAVRARRQAVLEQRRHDREARERARIKQPRCTKPGCGSYASIGCGTRCWNHTPDEEAKRRQRQMAREQKERERLVSGQRCDDPNCSAWRSRGCGTKCWNHTPEAQAARRERHEAERTKQIKAKRQRCNEPGCCAWASRGCRTRCWQHTPAQKRARAARQRGQAA